MPVDNDGYVRRGNLSSISSERRVVGLTPVLSIQLHKWMDASLHLRKSSSTTLSIRVIAIVERDGGRRGLDTG